MWWPSIGLDDQKPTRHANLLCHNVIVWNQRAT
jgi:hypothetical protein